MYNNYDYTNMYYPNMQYRREIYPGTQPNIILPERMDRYYGDDDDELEYNYFKSMYPEHVRKIMGYCEQMCDELDYEGSMMYDELPDKARVNRLVDEIYDKLNYVDEDDMYVPDMKATNVNKEDNDSEGKTVDATSFLPYNRCVRGRCGMRNFVQILLLNEMLRRRRRRGIHRRFRRRDYPIYWR